MRVAFGGLIAVILLGVYVYLVQLAIAVARCLYLDGCRTYKASDFNDAMAQAMSLIGGLVSALVIAELAITQPGEAPGSRLMQAHSSPRAMMTVRVITILYVLVWLGTGLWAFVTSLSCPSEVPPLTSLGQAWLGLAVAAAYSYFGIKPR